MFNPSSHFNIDGKLLGINVSVTVNLVAEEADASPLPSMGFKPLVVDVQNVQTLLLSAINGALIRLQHMDQKLMGESIDSIRVGRVATPQAAEPYNPEKDGKLQ